MKRNSSDDLIRSLERRVLSGDLSAVPSLARLYERIGAKPEKPRFRCSVCKGTNIQRVRWVDPNTDVAVGGEDPFDDPSNANYCVDCDGHTEFDDETVDRSVRQREARRAALGGWADPAYRLAIRSGLHHTEASEAVSYMLDFPEEAEGAAGPRSLALAALQWHEAVWLGNLEDAVAGRSSQDMSEDQIRAIHDRAARALLAFERGTT
jgi:hypothetical protein